MFFKKSQLRRHHGRFLLLWCPLGLTPCLTGRFLLGKLFSVRCTPNSAFLGQGLFCSCVSLSKSIFSSKSCFVLGFFCACSRSQLYCWGLHSKLGHSRYCKWRFWPRVRSGWTPPGLTCVCCRWKSCRWCDFPWSWRRRPGFWLCCLGLVLWRNRSCWCKQDSESC